MKKKLDLESSRNSQDRKLDVFAYDFFVYELIVNKRPT
jgi:hypothetical protein